MSKLKATPVHNVSDRVLSQYKHIESLTTKKDKAIFMNRMGFTPKQIVKKLSITYSCCMTFLKGISNNKLGVFL